MTQAGEKSCQAISIVDEISSIPCPSLPSRTGRSARKMLRLAVEFAWWFLPGSFVVQTHGQFRLGPCTQPTLAPAFNTGNDPLLRPTDLDRGTCGRGGQSLSG